MQNPHDNRRELEEKELEDYIDRMLAESGLTIAQQNERLIVHYRRSYAQKELQYQEAKQKAELNAKYVQVYKEALDKKDELIQLCYRMIKIQYKYMIEREKEIIQLQAQLNTKK